MIKGYLTTDKLTGDGQRYTVTVPELDGLSHTGIAATPGLCKKIVTAYPHLKDKSLGVIRKDGGEVVDFIINNIEKQSKVLYRECPSSGLRIVHC